MKEDIYAVSANLSVELGIKSKNDRKFLISMAGNKVYSVILSHSKIKKLRFLVVNDCLVGALNQKICAFGAPKNENISFYFDDQSISIPEFNQDDLKGKTFIHKNKVYFLNALKQIIVIFKHTGNRIAVNRMLFIFDKPIVSVCFAEEDMFVCSEDKFVYQFRECKHENQVFVEERIYALNAILKDFLLVLTEKSIDLYEKTYLSKVNSIEFKGKIKEKTKFEVVGEHVVFILEGDLVFLNLMKEEVTAALPNTSTFAVQDKYVLASSSGSLVSFNEKGKETSRIKLGELEVKDIFSDS